ncbi:FAD-dependent oxidoreductase [Desulfosarcina sp.]|uniref:FAD/NAD(P)-dependent oxidoreductase n=1 Tax=Desulfosarcina sp. TaxID=2027861 RepID=UPI00397109BD
MNNRHQVIIVGSGLAGIAAAELLSGHGLDLLVIDDNAHIGGQLLRNPPHYSRVRRCFEPDRLKSRGLRLAQRISKQGVHFLHRTQVLGIYPERTVLVEAPGGRVSEHQADTIVLATGARERHLPFKGWTLPGVISTGAAQILMKSSGILPGRSTLIGGCSPLMLVLAAEIASHGGGVQAVLDQSPLAGKIDALFAGPAIWPKLLEGAFYLLDLAARRVPVKQGVRIVEARGRSELTAVVSARTDSGGRILPGTERIYHTDTLAVGYGFSPNIELPQQAGCAISYAADKGGWIVDVDPAMATSEPGIYAAGETTGIAGAGKSFIEGQIAAWDILLKTGRVDRRCHGRHVPPLAHLRRHQVRYGRFLNRLCRPAPACYADIPDETIICRCEEVTMDEIRRQLTRGFSTLNGIKRATRSTMGNCQGRTCGPILADIIGALTHLSPEAAGCPSARAPVKTVALGALAKLPDCRSGHQDCVQC